MRRTAVATLLFALTLTSCTGKDPAPSSSAAPVATPSPIETAFVNGGDCIPMQVAGLRSPAGCISSVTTREETLTVYAVVGRDSRPKSWRIHLSTEDGDLDQVLPAGNAFSYPRVVGSSDVVGDERPEWWVKVRDFTSHGAPWSGMNLFVSKQPSLEPVHYEGEPLSINYGGISRMGEGARCRARLLILLRAEAKNPRNTRWRVSERHFLLQGAKAALHIRSEGVLVIKGYNDPALDPYYRVRCKGFEFP